MKPIAYHKFNPEDKKYLVDKIFSECEYFQIFGRT